MKYIVELYNFSLKFDDLKEAIAFVEFSVAQGHKVSICGVVEDD